MTVSAAKQWQSKGSTRVGWGVGGELAKEGEYESKRAVRGLTRVVQEYRHGRDGKMEAR